MKERQTESGLPCHLHRDPAYCSSLPAEEAEREQNLYREAAQQLLRPGAPGAARSQGQYCEREGITKTEEVLRVSSAHEIISCCCSLLVRPVPEAGPSQDQEALHTCQAANKTHQTSA